MPREVINSVSTQFKRLISLFCQFSLFYILGLSADKLLKYSVP